MSRNNQIDVYKYLLDVYTDTDNAIIANKLGVFQGHVRKLASKYGIKKSDSYLKKQHKQIDDSKKRKISFKYPRDCPYY